MQVFLLLLVGLSFAQADTVFSGDEKVKSVLEGINKDLLDLYGTRERVEYSLEIMSNDNTSFVEMLKETDEKIFEFVQNLRPTLAKMKRFPILSGVLKRQLDFLPSLGFAVLSLEDSKKVQDIMTSLEKYKETLRGYCGINSLKGGEKEAEELKECWEKKSAKLSDLVKDDWGILVGLIKKTANYHGFNHASDYWIKKLEMPSKDAMETLGKFLNELWPLFEQFHAYIRQNLRVKYGVENVPLNQPIPYHLYDSYVYNNWDNIDVPFPQTPKRPIAEGLMKNGLNSPRRAFLNIGEFYRSLGFPHLNQEFWENSTAEANNDDCEFKVFNLFEPDEQKFTYCGEINEKKFRSLFQDLFEILFFKSVQHLPAVFQIEPMPQFVDALGKGFALNFESPEYLRKLKLLDETETNNEANINFLYEMGFRNLLPLPMMYILERIRAYSLDSKQNNNFNCLYWDLLGENVGVAPPSMRKNEDFDFAEKLLADVQNELVSSIFSIILRFQIFEHFCDATKQYSKTDPSRPLYMCDLSNQPSIGPKVLKAMSLGATKPYPRVLEEITGQPNISTKGIIEYFKPLYQWFLEKNEMDQAVVGWEQKPSCTSSEA